MTDILAFVLFLAPVPGWSATIILVAAALRRPRIAALTERAVTAVILSTAATALAVLGFARLGRVTVDRDIVTLVLAFVALAVSAPAVVWLVAFLKGSFRGDE